MRRALAVLIALVATVSGCQATSPPASGGQTLEEAVGYSDAAWERLRRAQDDAVVACMRDAGFVFKPETDWNFLTNAPHGLFELTTPTAVRSYLDRYGYGMAQRVRALVRSAEEIRTPNNEDYFERLSGARKAAFVAALQGDGDSAGCFEQASAETHGVHLPSGGLLGEAYGEAISDLYASGEYRAWASEVAACMQRRGVTVADGDLSTASRPFLKRMLELTGADFETDSEGRIHYSLDSAGFGADVLDELPALRSQELAAAPVEGACRDEHAEEIRRLMVEYSAPVIEDHPEVVDKLRAALARVS